MKMEQRNEQNLTKKYLKNKMIQNNEIVNILKFYAVLIFKIFDLSDLSNLKI